MVYYIHKIYRKHTEIRKKGQVNDMKKKLYGQFITEMGCCVYATITVNEDYTMNEVVREVKRLGYKAFCLATMKRFVYL